MRIYSKVTKTRRILHVDTQETRRKLIEELNEVFDISSNYAKGKDTWIAGEEGKERPLKVVERQFWARVAAHTAQAINNVARGFDERQIDCDLDMLEAMLNKAAAADKAAMVSGEQPRKSEGT